MARCFAYICLVFKVRGSLAAEAASPVYQVRSLPSTTQFLPSWLSQGRTSTDTITLQPVRQANTFYRATVVPAKNLIVSGQPSLGNHQVLEPLVAEAGCEPCSEPQIQPWLPHRHRSPVVLWFASGYEPDELPDCSTVRCCRPDGEEPYPIRRHVTVQPSGSGTPGHWGTLRPSGISPSWRTAVNRGKTVEARGVTPGFSRRDAVTAAGSRFVGSLEST